MTREGSVTEEEEEEQKEKRRGTKLGERTMFVPVEETREGQE